MNLTKYIFSTNYPIPLVKNRNNTFFIHIFVNAKKCLVMKKIYILISLVLNIVCAQGQVTIATTHIVNNGQNGVTFNVKNNGATALRLFGINSAHFTEQPTVASTVTVWYKISSSTVAPAAITVANGWTNAGTYTLNRTYTAVTPFISNLAIDIPKDSTCKVFVGTSQTLGYETLTAGTVNTFTSGTTDLLTGDNISFGGPATGPTFTPRGFVGSVVVYPLVGCVGAPEVGNIKVVGTPGACPTENRLFYLENYISGNNITYQWQFATSPAGVYTNIAGNNTTILARTMPAVSQYYRCIATCGTSTLKDTTPVFADTIKPFYLCYCASFATDPDDTKIDSVVLSNTRTGSPSSTCEVYTDYRTSIPITLLRAGNTYNVEVVNGSCTNNFFGSSGAVFVDFNKSGVFDVAERLGAGWTATGLQQRFFNSLVIPLNPVAYGITGLRVIHKEPTGVPTAVCGTYSFGETEDYLVQIIKDSIDAQLNAIVNLESGCSLGNTTISVNVSNIGHKSISPLPMCYSVNGGTPVCENLAPLAIGTTTTFNFATQANLIGQGSKTLKIWHNNPLDTNKSNDTIFKTIINFPTPPDPIADHDTVCNGSPQTILRAPSFDSFMTRWYTDLAATNEVGQGNQFFIPNPTTNNTRYAKSVYTYTTNFGPTVFAPEVLVGVAGVGNGLFFDVLKNKVRINSVLMKFSNVGLGAIEIRNPANAVIFTKSFIVKAAGAQVVDLGIELPIGTGYRILLNTNPSQTVATSAFTNFPQQVPGVIRITSSTTANQYNFFYDWNITYDACVSNMVTVNSEYIGTTASPVRTLYKDTFFCEYPDVYLNANNAGCTYKWHDNTLNQTIKLTTSGYYIVTITNSIGCNIIDSSKIKINKSPIFSLGNDTTVCTGFGAKLKSGFSNAGYNHIWNTGSLEPEITVVNAGTYIVNVFNTNTNCGYSDTTKVNYKQSPYAFIGRDTFACNQSPITIKAPFNTNYLYSWNNGAQSSKNDTLVNSKGNNKIWVEITDISNAYGCKSSDTAIVRIANLTKPNLGLDKVSCNPLEVIGLTQNDTLTYRWNTGETSNIVKKSTAGTYILTVTEVGTTCTYSDTINLSFVPHPPLDLGPDITTCDKKPITLKANAGWTTYSWSNGFAIPTITVSTNNTYTVTATNSCGSISDNITVTYLDTVVGFTLPIDMLNVCSPVSLSVPAQTAPNIINWSTGETSNSISINKTGVYWASISNTCGAKSDAIYIKFDTIPTPDFKEQIAGTFIAFANKSINAVSYKWYFGDDSTSTDVNPTHKYLQKGTFQVRLVATNSCGDSVILTKTITLYNSGINAIDINNVSIYPNPSSDKFTVQLADKKSKEYTLDLMTIDGRLIKSIYSKSNTDNQLEIDVNEVSIGTYWLKLTDQDNNQIIKHVTISR